MVAHAGGQPETSTLLVTLPAEDVVIALATNLEDDAKRLRRVSSRIVEVLLEDGCVRREPASVDAVDTGLSEGFARLFTYGLAYHGWVTRGPGALPDPGDVAGAFTQMSALLDRGIFVEDPKGALERVKASHQPRMGALAIRVGVEMARTLERVYGPERLSEYPAHGALAFFTDYLAACEQEDCPEALRFTEGVRAEGKRLEESWRRSQVEGLARARLDEVKDPEALWPALEAATAGAALHPDYAQEMVRVAARFGKQGKHAEQVKWLERAVVLHPRSEEARQALVKLMGPAHVPLLPSVALPLPASEGGAVPDNAGQAPQRRAGNSE